MRRNCTTAAVVEMVLRTSRNWGLSGVYVIRCPRSFGLQGWLSARRNAKTANVVSLSYRFWMFSS